jgi:hypothetical protein
VKALAGRVRIVLAAAILVTCVHSAGRPFLAEIRVESQIPRWPAAAADAHVVYLGQISVENELGSRRSWLSHLVRWISGSV